MVRYKFVHFNKRSDFDSYVPNPESNSANGNEYYNYVVFIKDTKEIYTHGQFYNCSDSGDSSIDEILEELKSSINSKADLSSLEALIKEVEENEEVTAAALTELHENKADKSEIPDVSNLVTKNEFNILSAEVEEKVDSTIFTTLSETVAGHTTNINNLSDNKADKTDLEDYAKKDDLNTKQDQLVSGTTIKTVNGNSILGSGNIETPDTKVTSADNHYGYDANNAISTTGAFVTKITKDAANHVTSFESRALTSTDIPELDASKITSGEISIDRLPKGALERLFVVESEAAAISATVQEGDVVQVTGNNNKMYFCISNTATTFATKFKEFTAGTATSVPWSGITGKPTGIDGWGDRIGVIESGYATQSWVGENYLSKSGGKLVYSGAQGLEAERTDGAPTHIMFIGLVNGTTRQLGGFGMNGYNDPVYVNPNGVRHKVLTAENYTDYALSINGGTVNGSITANSFVGNLVGVADKSKVLGDYYGERTTSANLDFTDSAVRKIIATSSMTTAKPPADGSILHFAWDNTGGWNHQLFIAGGGNADPDKRMAWRAQSYGSWSEWKSIAFTDSNVASATKLATARNIFGHGFNGTQNILGGEKSIEINSINAISDDPNNWIENYSLKLESANNAMTFMVDKTENGRKAMIQVGHNHPSYANFLGALYLNPLGGNVAIGGTTADEKLHIHGNVKASGSMYAVDFATTSDNRLKDFVSDIYVDFESIKQIPKKYYY